VAGIEAFFFDQDGVIVDTERDGHRVAFNEAFREFGYPVEWDVETYGRLLRIAGGKERLRHFLRSAGFGRRVAEEEEEELVGALHKRKTELFIELIESGRLSLRPGIRRLMGEIREASLGLGICTTSDERAAKAILRTLLAGIHFDLVLAGDVVRKKKPDPEIYLLALRRTGLNPESCVVIEDSENGVAAANAAGLPVIVTTNLYTERDELAAADIVLSCLGDPDGERGRLLRARKPLAFDGVLRLRQILDFYSA
jgi:HAD superfamily hydrolase (TIGR01509 family)